MSETTMSEKSMNSFKLKHASRRSTSVSRAHSMEEDLDAILTGLQLCPEVVADAIRQKSRETSKEMSHATSCQDENSWTQLPTKTEGNEKRAKETQRRIPLQDLTSLDKMKTKSKLLDSMDSFDEGRMKNIKRKDSNLKPCTLCQFLFFHDENDQQECICPACKLRNQTRNMPNMSTADHSEAEKKAEIELQKAARSTHDEIKAPGEPPTKSEPVLKAGIKGAFKRLSLVPVARHLTRSMFFSLLLLAFDAILFV
eukprot:469121-Hanusia_phi.AAC.1